MNQAEYLVAAARVNGTSCDQEAIHIPGLIQPFGYLVAINAIGRITRVSENLCEILGVQGEELINQDIAVVDPKLRDIAKNPGDIDAKIRLKDRSLVGRCFKANDEWVVELQPQDEVASPSMLRMFHQSILDIGRQQSLDEVVSCLPGLVKELTGYDRVMVYRFDDEGHGDGTCIVDELRHGVLLVVREHLGQDGDHGLSLTPANRSSSGRVVSTLDRASWKSSVGHTALWKSIGTANHMLSGSIWVRWASRARSRR